MPAIKSRPHPQVEKVTITFVSYPNVFGPKISKCFTKENCIITAIFQMRETEARNEKVTCTRLLCESATAPTIEPRSDGSRAIPPHQLGHSSKVLSCLAQLLTRLSGLISGSWWDLSDGTGTLLFVHVRAHTCWHATCLLQSMSKQNEDVSLSFLISSGASQISMIHGALLPYLSSLINSASQSHSPWICLIISVLPWCRCSVSELLLLLLSATFL